MEERLDLSPWHHLQLIDKLESDGKNDVCCQLCKKPVLGSRGYKCSKCIFFLHESCLEPTNNTEITTTHNWREIHHLISMKVLDNNGENKVFNCSMCKERVSCLSGNNINGPTIYTCSIPKCSFLLHQPCENVPITTTHPLHLSSHTLELNPPVETQYCCGACGKCFRRNFFYKCSDCDYRLDIRCGSHWKIGAKKCDQHSFIPTKNHIMFTCEVCGMQHTDIAYLCCNCRLLIHSNCAQFLGTIKIRGHSHSLTCTFSLSRGKDHNMCQICFAEVNKMYAAYCCDYHNCDYVAHVRCAYWIRKVSETNDSNDDATYLVEGNDLEVDKNVAPQQIQHWSHPQHKLILKNEELLDLRRCVGCMQFIVLSPFYHCERCNFSLHVRCTKLPHEVMRPLHHPHPLFLHNLQTFFSWACKQAFFCWACNRNRGGFSYKCREGCSGATFDAQCILIPEVFKHKGHQHSLFLGKFDQLEFCSACGQQPHGAEMFECITCKFFLCIKCATLPLIARHRYDPHILYLTCVTEDESGEYYCQICEEERIGKLWFYYCKICDFATHSQCIL